MCKHIHIRYISLKSRSFSHSDIIVRPQTYTSKNVIKTTNGGKKVVHTIAFSFIKTHTYARTQTRVSTACTFIMRVCLYLRVAKQNVL